MDTYDMRVEFDAGKKRGPRSWGKGGTGSPAKNMFIFVFIACSYYLISLSLFASLRLFVNSDF